MFVTIQRENIRPSKKEMNKARTCPMFAISLWSLRRFIADQ
jgi:hypothetical protein